MELNGGGKKNNNAETTWRTELNIAEASASLLRQLTLGEGQSLGFRSLHQGADAVSMQQMSSRAGENMDPKYYPERPGEPYCPYHLNSGYCRLGMHCKFNHPPRVPGGIGQPTCQHYLETGQCNFGCKFRRDKYNPRIIKRYEFNALGYPLRSNAMDCKFYLLNGSCKFGKTCTFNHPEPSNSMPWWLSRTMHSQTLCPGEPTSFNASPHWQGPSQAILPQGLAQVPSWNTFPYHLNQQHNSGNVQVVGSRAAMRPPAASYSSFPVRPGEPDCPFFVKTGKCKFGSGCRFNHPIRKMPCKLSPEGLPLRPGQPTCAFYGHNGFCGYGTRCKFDHPMAARKGITDGPSTSSSDVPVVQQPLESSSESSLLAIPGKLERRI